jgi:hypothetical protein
MNGFLAVAHLVAPWLVAGAVMAAPAAAQQRDRPAPASAGRWLPREVRLVGDFSAAERAAAIATLDRVEQVLRRVPELSNPNGFEILPVIGGGATQLGPGEKPLPGSVVEYALSLMIFYPTRAIAGEGCSCITVSINPKVSARMHDEQGRGIYIEPERGKPPANANISDFKLPQRATQVYGELWNVPRERSMVDVLFVTAGELPWRLVTREAFYRATLFDLEGAKGEKLADFRADLAKTPYQEWMEGAEQRKKDREQTLAQLVGIQPPAEIEKMRKAMEDTERQVTEQLRATEAADRERNRDALSRSFGQRDSMLAELGRMSPAERRMPAYINNALESGPFATGWRMSSDSLSPAWRVLTPNYDFWRARRSRVEVRSIQVHIGITGTGLYPEVQNALWQTYHKLDWAAFNRLVETQR